ncbi:hypothetical protein RvY_08912-2 [Ramazzottius varieornatus]|uniref:Uncharacterized protein n=1 Tax=Ramazzottius varieornatus TaxID=947166 RepID=A0A1D1VC40_RAMVA|nr:hypothetical protein RvY_08912-2 [Ramazzottius varieornatus]
MNPSLLVKRGDSLVPRTPTMSCNLRLQMTPYATWSAKPDQSFLNTPLEPTSLASHHIARGSPERQFPALKCHLRSLAALKERGTVVSPIPTRSLFPMPVSDYSPCPNFRSHDLTS